MAGSNYFEDLVFKVIADTKSAQEGLVQLSGKMQELNKHAASSATGMEKFAGKAKVAAGVAVAAFALAATAITAFAVKAVQAASEQQLAITRLNLTLKNVTGATDEAAQGVQDYIVKLSLATGIMDDQLRPAMDQLARQTRNLADSQKLLALALDISAGTGDDVLTVATALGSAYNGNFSQLQRLKTGLSETTIQTQDFGKATTELSGIFKGQAEKQADTFTGKMNRLRVALKNTQEAIGTALMPIFQYMINFINQLILPVLDKFTKYLLANPKAVQQMVNALAKFINVMVDVVQIVIIVTDGLIGLLSIMARVVQGLGYISGNDAMKDWGRNTAESLDKASAVLNAFEKKLAKFDATKYAQGIKFDLKLDTGGVTGKGLGTGLGATIAAGWNDAAKSILDSAKKVKSTLNEVLGFSIKKQIADLSLDPLVVSLRDAKLASVDYAKAQNNLMLATQASAKADLAYIKSMADVSDAGKLKSESLKSFADSARDNAIQAASDTQTALQRIQEAQRAYADETISRVKSIRSAFQSATQFDIGSTVSNIENAKKSLADAEFALQDAQNKWKNNIPSQAYAGVVVNTAVPIFDAEKRAVDKAKEDLAIALGEKKSPFTATVDELNKALKSAYDNAVELSKTAGELAGAGFSQDFITQIINAGPVLGVQIGKAVLATNTPTQENMKTIFNKLDETSKTGLNALSISLNQGAIDAMDSFIEGITTQVDPLDKLIKAIEDRVNAMVTTIGAAIKATLAQIAALSGISTTPSPAPATDYVPSPASPTGGTSGKGKSGGSGGGGGQLIDPSQYPTGTSLGAYQEYRSGERASSPTIQVVVNNSINNDAHAMANEIGYAIKTSGDVVYGYNRFGNLRVAGRGD